MIYKSLGHPVKGRALASPEVLLAALPGQANFGEKKAPAQSPVPRGEHAVPTQHQVFDPPYPILQNCSQWEQDKTERQSPLRATGEWVSLPRCSCLLSCCTVGTWQISDEPPKA